MEIVPKKALDVLMVVHQLVLMDLHLVVLVVVDVADHTEPDLLLRSKISALASSK